MAGNKKPRKPMRATRLAIPMLVMRHSVAQAKPLLCDALLAQIQSFVLAPSIATGNSLARELACVAGGLSHQYKGAAIRGRTDAGSIAIVSAVHCMEGIGSRHDRTGIVAVTDSEKKTLNAAAPHLYRILSAMPLACYLKAEGEADMWLKESTYEEAAA